MVNGAGFIVPLWVNFDAGVAEGRAEAGGMLLRVIVALGLGAVLLSVAAQVALPLWHQYVAMVAAEQAAQRASSVTFELASALATSDTLPEALRWIPGHDDALSLTARSSITGHMDSYRWGAEGAVWVQRIGRRGSERLADGITAVVWQPDPSLQGGWLRIEAMSDRQAFALPLLYREGCHADVLRACRTLVRYIAHPALLPDAGLVSVAP